MCQIMPDEKYYFVVDCTNSLNEFPMKKEAEKAIK